MIHEPGVTIAARVRIVVVRPAIALALALLPTLPACEIGSSDDGSDAQTSDAEGSDDPGQSTAPAPETSTVGSTTAPEPTEGGDVTTQGDGADSSSDTGSTGETEQPQPPTDGAELLPWLEAGEYLAWAAESGVHPSSGPHGGGVRTFVNDVLLASLAAGSPSHPVGAAAIKELYGDGGSVIGWAVEVKLQADSAGGDGWYWYELFGTDLYADGTGEGICTGCHGGGNDYVLTPFPLQ